MHSRGFRTSDPPRNTTGQSTEMSPLVSMLFRTFLNSLKFLLKNLNILVITVRRKIFATKKFRESLPRGGGRNIRDKNICEGGSDT